MTANEKKNEQNAHAKALEREIQNGFSLAREKKIPIFINMSLAIV